MPDRKADLAVLVYNLAVIVSGVFVTTRLASPDRWLLFGLVFVLAVFWTVYFRYSMFSRLQSLK